MTDAEWFVCAKPETMLTALHQAGRLTHRKVMLFDCACVRRVWDMLTDERSRRAVEVAERFADGQVSVEELENAGRAAFDAWQDFQRGQANVWQEDPVRWETLAMSAPMMAFRAASAACCWTAVNDPSKQWPHAAGDVVRAVADRRMYSPEGERAFHNAIYNRQDRKSWDIGHFTTDEEAEQCRLLRDIFPSPFLTVKIDREWLSSTVGALARGIDEEQTFDQLPILADALQDAGCDNNDILDHCRAEGLHVRGCWVVDALLGRE